MEPGRKSDPIYRSPSPLIEGRQLANIAYTDGKGFSESVSTEAFSFPSQTLKITEQHPIIVDPLQLGKIQDLEAVGDLDWFKVELEADKVTV